MASPMHGFLPALATDMARVEAAEKHCRDCGSTFTATTHAPGYAAQRDTDARFCYPCAHKREVAEWNASLAGEPFCAYLTRKTPHGWAVTNWTGGHLANVTDLHKVRRYTPTATFDWYYIRAIDPNGRHWYGGGPGEGMYCRMRPNKVKGH